MPCISRLHEASNTRRSVCVRPAMAACGYSSLRVYRL